MRCDCCNKVLSTFELSIKHSIRGEYLYTCLDCLDGLGIPFEGDMKLLQDVTDPLTDDLDSDTM